MNRCGRRRFLKRLFLVAAVAGLLGASPASAGEYRTVEVESLKITIDSEWAVRIAPGYLPVRFDITNLGEPRVIEITGLGTRFFRAPRPGPGGGIAVRHEVRLARGDHVRLTVPVPIYADSENIQFEIRENGRSLERFNYSGVQGRTAASDSSALIVADPGSAFGKVAASWMRRAGGSGPGGRGAVIVGPTGSSSPPGSLPLLDLTLEPARLPTNWLGFTSLRAIFIGPTEWDQLNVAQKEALLTWTACGGNLMFVDGALGALLPGTQPPALPANPAVKAHFFGRIHLPTSLSLGYHGLAAAIAAASTAQDGNFALPANSAADWGVIATRGFRLPIPGIDGVPARAYLAILIVFSILIGPVNYWFFRRLQRQALVVLTAPLISALSIALLAGYVLAGEGIGVRGRAATFTMLDEARKQAVTRASISLYAAGMTPAGGLRFGRDVAVFPIGPDGTGSREGTALDLTDDQRFVSGAIRARSPTNLEQISSRPARERLTFSRDAGGLSVVNGLGRTLAVLLFNDGTGVHTLAAPLLAGSKALLHSDSRDRRGLVPADLPQSSRFQYLFDHPPAGSYLAVLEGSPFWDPGVTGILERGSFHLVLGWPGGQP